MGRSRPDTGRRIDTGPIGGARAVAYVVYAVLSAFSSLTCPAVALAEPLDVPALSYVRQIRTLGAHEAALHYPVRIAGVVTYSDRAGERFYVQDDTGGVDVRMAGGEIDLESGQRVEVEGVTVSQDGIPGVEASQVRIVGRGALPRARPISLVTSDASSQIGTWSEIECVVHARVDKADYVSLSLTANATDFKAVLPLSEGEALPPALVDARVRIRGVCGPSFNRNKQLTGIVLLIPKAEHVVVEVPGPADPYDAPPRRIESLLRYTPDESAHRVRVRGVLTLQRPGRALFLQDDTGGIYVYSEQETALEPGDVLDVLGYVYTLDSFPAMYDAEFRVVEKGPPPQGLRVTPHEVLDGNYDSRLVEVEATLLSHGGIPGEQDLLLETDGMSFNAYLRDVPVGEALSALRDGSRLKVTGVCAVRVDDDQVPTSFVIYPRSPADVVVVRSPPWFGLTHALWALAAAGCLAGASAVWVIVLRRRVRAQTDVIRRQIDREVAIDRRYRELFENATDVVFTTDLDGNFTSMNAAGEQTTGYTHDEIERMNIRALAAPESADAILRILDTGRGKSPPLELDVVTRDGDRVTLEVNSRLISEGGEPAAFEGIAHNVTDRKRIEAELERARDAAENSARIKAEFLANMSHEIRTPMNGIIGMADLLLDTELTEPQREFAEAIQSCGGSLLTIINDILDFSKIEAGKLGLEAVEFDLRRLVEDTLELLADGAQRKGLELACEVSSDVPGALLGDAGRLRQILTNLVGNAVKFTERGEVVVRVDAAERWERDVLVRFEIADTGVGIPEEARSRLFQSFAQADGSTTRRFGGTGLGLAISKRLVEVMGGEISFESEAGAGSTFRFTARFEIATVPGLDEESSANDDLVGRRVLVVDDNATNREILARQTATWGMVCETVGGGAEAFERLEAAARRGAQFEVAIVDFHMPGMDGLELASRIRADRATREVRTLILTPYGAAELAQRPGHAGVEAYLAKPVKQRQLRRALEMMLDAPSAAPAALSRERYAGAERSRGSVLVVDDNAGNQLVAKLQVEKLGFRVDVVANGLEAVEASERVAYDLILMDCQMPEMDGFEATAVIRRREHGGQRVPIVAMTANVLDGERERCLAAGMDDFLAKPTKLETLGLMLERWVDPRRH